MNLLLLISLGLLLSCCQPPTPKPTPAVEVAVPIPEELRSVKEIPKEQPKVENKSIPHKAEAVQQSVDKAWSATIRYQHIIQEDKR